MKSWCWEGKLCYPLPTQGRICCHGILSCLSTAICCRSFFPSRHQPNTKQSNHQAPAVNVPKCDTITGYFTRSLGRQSVEGCSLSLKVLCHTKTRHAKSYTPKLDRRPKPIQILSRLTRVALVSKCLQILAKPKSALESAILTS